MVRAMVVRFFASIRSITGVREIEWGEPVPTLGALLHLLSDRYGPEFRRWVLDGEELGGSVMVVVNGNDARHQTGLGRQLAPTDVISILPIMAGGCAARAISVQRIASSNQLLERARKRTGAQGFETCCRRKFLRCRSRLKAES